MNEEAQDIDNLRLKIKEYYSNLVYERLNIFKKSLLKLTQTEISIFSNMVEQLVGDLVPIQSVLLPVINSEVLRRITREEDFNWDPKSMTQILLYSKTFIPSHFADELIPLDEPENGNLYYSIDYLLDACYWACIGHLSTYPYEVYSQSTVVAMADDLNENYVSN